MSARNSSVALPSHVQRLLASCPQSGAGVHQWLFRCALALHRYVPEPKIAELLETASACCGRALEPHEIPDAIRNSRAYVNAPTGQQGANKTLQRWPVPNVEQIEAVVRNGVHLVDLWERSPVRLDERSTAEELIDQLFPGNPLLCCGWTNKQFGTGTREEWRGQLNALQFIVPNPMIAEQGRRKSDGTLSPRTLENTGPRQYLVIECDFNPIGVTPVALLTRTLSEAGITVADMCAAVLWRLSELAPLAMVVHSGGKSLHGWFPCTGQPEDRLRKFMRYAVSLGADNATWTRCQLVRMPEGLRQRDGAPAIRQQVYYFNPEVLQ